MRVAAAVLALTTAIVLSACSGEDAGPGDDQASPDAGAAGELPFMSECTLGMDEACETGLCFDFNTKGPHCTHACEVDTDCEDPSPGCNGMGVCKAPDDGGGGGGGDGGGGG